MNEHQFFSFVPHLNNYVIKPSPDHTAELKLILNNSGACMGISHAEKKIIDLIDGVKNLGQIIAKIDSDAIASYMVLKTLLKDLDRYGFLRESPWQIEESINNNYWGIPTVYCKSVSWTFNLPIVLKTISKVIVSPYYIFLALFASCILSYFTLYQTEPILLNQQSVAMAGLYVIIGCFIAAGLLNFLYAIVLSEIHQKSVKWLIDFQYGFPVLRLDARRLCSLSLVHSLSTISGPIFSLLIIANCLMLLNKAFATQNNPLLFISAGIYLLIFFLFAPWFSTILSREVSIRLRQNHVKNTMWNALFYLLRPFSKKIYCQLIYKRLYIMWGIWSLLYVLFSFGIVYTFSSLKIEQLSQSIIHDDNRLAVFILFCFMAIIAAAATSSMIVFGLKLFHHFFVQLKKCYWPKHDNLLALMGMTLILCLFLPFIELTQLHQELQLGASSLITSIILMTVVVISWNKEGWCYESLIHVPLLLLVSSFFMRGIAWFSELTAVRIPIDYAYQPYGHVNVYQSMSNWLMIISVIVYLVYLFCFHLSWFQFLDRFDKYTLLKLLGAGFCFGLFGGLWYFIPFEETIIGIFAQTLFLLISFYLALSLFWFGSIRNGSFIMIALALLVSLSGVFWSKETTLFLTNDFAVFFSMLLILIAYFFRASAVVKTALGLNINQKDLKPISEWKPDDLNGEIKRAVKELYGLAVAVKFPDEEPFILLRDSFFRLHRIIGKEAIIAVTRRVSLNIPWYESQIFSSVLPQAVTYPTLNCWNKDRLLNIIQKVPNFALCQDDELNEIINVSRFSFFNPGEALIRQSQNEKDFYIILDGLTSVEQENIFSHRIIAFLRQNDFAGEIGFLTEKPRTATVRAMRPTLTLCLHRKDITPGMRSLFQKLLSSDLYQNWQFYLKRTNLLSEFNPSLNERVFLESKRIVLESQQTIFFDNSEFDDKIIVFLSGKAFIIKGDQKITLQEGQLLGLSNCFQNQSVTGFLQVSEHSKFLVIEQSLLKKSLCELLTPEECYHMPSRYKFEYPVLLKGRYRFT